MQPKEIVVKIEPGLEKLIPKFLTTQKSQIELMATAFKSKDFSELVNLGHKMYGSCGGYGFSVIGDIAKKIELAADEKKEDVIAPLITELVESFSNLKIEYIKK